MSNVATDQHPRRTQSERRAATSTALLDATIDCLAEEGYAQTTTRRVAERAGVSPGALQHHFDTKIELLGRAREHLGGEFVREVTKDSPSWSLSVRRRNEILLDRWWKFFSGPRFQAATELTIAARTDVDLRVRLQQAEDDNAHLYMEGATAVYPKLAEHEGIKPLMITAISTLRGLAMLRLVNEQAAEHAWHSTRAHLLALFDGFGGDPS